MKMHLPKMLASALVAAFTALMQASGSITAENAAGWAVYQGSNWITSESFVGSITTSAQSDLQFKDSGGNYITFGSGSRSSYTFAVELDLSMLVTPVVNTSMVWGSNKVGFGLEASTRNVTAAIGSTAKWNTTDTALPTSGTATIVVTTGDDGSRIYVYNGSGTLLNPTENRNFWSNLKEGSPSTHFYISQIISPAVTKFAVWQTDNLATASANDMLSAYNAMAQFPLAPPTACIWQGTEDYHNWSNPEAWSSALGVSPVIVLDGTSSYKTVTMDTAASASSISVSGAVHTIDLVNNLATGSLSIAANSGLVLSGSGTLSIGGAPSVASGSLLSVGADSTLQVTSANMASLGALSISGEGTLRLVTTTLSQANNALGTLSAANLELADNSSHTGRYYYSGDTNFSGVEHLHLAGGQLWLNADMTYGGKVTFNATTYTESGQAVLNGAAMRINASATFNGAVNVAAATKLAFATDGTIVAFGGAVTGSGQLELKSWNNKNGTFTVTGDASGYTGAIKSDSRITLNVAENAQLTLAGGSNLAGAVTLNGILTVNSAEETTATISGVISGAGSLVKEGMGTLKLFSENTYTGDTLIKGGTLYILGSIANSTVKVAENATIAGNTEDINLAIAAGQTAMITEGPGFSPKDSGVTFCSLSGVVEIKNVGETEITYSIGEEKAKVTADGLMSKALGADPIVVNNELNVKTIANEGTGAITLSHADAQALEGVYAYGGEIILKNITEISLAEMTIAPESMVSVYTNDTATIEGTVIITELLTVRGGTLLANLTMQSGSTLNVAGGGEMALTLGSQFMVDNSNGLVTLDDATLEAIAALENIGDTLILINQYQGSQLTTNLTNGAWAREYFDLSSITDADYKMYVTGTEIGFVKSSNVPEPTTGTLSLLALAALIARRRRK